MDFGIQGKTALVMASSQGLGRAIAESLAGEGCNLLICARGAEKIDRVAREIAGQHGVKVTGIAADVSTSKGRQSLLASAGGVDILVTNSGGPSPGGFDDFDNDDWQAAYQLVFESVLEMVRGVLPHMKQQSWGRIIAVNSVCVKEPISGLTLSNGIRPAVSGMLRSLADELAELGITVNNVMSGYHRTERVVQLGLGDEVAQGIPMKRMGEPREFAAAVSFLASQQASYITGTSLPVDGGSTRSLL